MDCKRTRKSWLYRAWEVVTPEGRFRVDYDGRGAGVEIVLVQGKVVVSAQNRYGLAPRFDFQLGSQAALIEVRVWPWLWLRSIRLSIGGQIVCEEGRFPAG